MTELEDSKFVSILAMNDTGPAPEAAIVRDMVKRGLWVAPVLVAIGALVWGTNGAWSTAYGLVLVLGNFVMAAMLVSYTARISYAVMMGSMMFGYLLRLAIISFAVYAVRQTSWVELLPLGLTIIVTHIGLLFWELRYVSLSLAFPGLKPSSSQPTDQSLTT
ncbi:MAG: ATP synthase subunit I [Ilumatobacteraceae bacterium]